MTDVSKPMQAPPDDPAEQMAAMQRIGEKSQRVVELWLGKGGAGTLPVSADLAGDFMRMTQHVLANPLALVETQTEFWQDYLTLWQRTTQRMLGLEAEPMIAPAKDDRRFKHEQWSENAAFDFIKQRRFRSEVRQGRLASYAARGRVASCSWKTSCGVR